MKFKLLLGFLLFMNLADAQSGVTFSMPNAFTDSAKIEFTLQTSDIVSLRIYNQWGDNVSTPFNNATLSAGTYTTYLRGDTLPLGNYYLQFTSLSGELINRVLVKVDHTTALLDIDNEKLSSFFPNPASNVLNITDEGTKEICFFNSMGQLVDRLNTDSKIVPLDNLENGQYLISICSKKCQTGYLQIVK